MPEFYLRSSEQKYDKFAEDAAGSNPTAAVIKRMRACTIPKLRHGMGYAQISNCPLIIITLCPLHQKNLSY